MVFFEFVILYSSVDDGEVLPSGFTLLWDDDSDSSDTADADDSEDEKSDDGSDDKSEKESKDD